MNEIKIPPRIERISDQEVYLMSPDGIRTQRICGKIRDGISAEYPCVNKAGEGTSHFGVGYCSEHDTTLMPKAKTRNTYEVLIDKENKRSIIDYISIVSASENEHHTSIDPEIELLEALIASILSKMSKQETLTIKNAEDIAKLSEKLAKLKKMKIDALKKEKLDSEVVAKFLGGVMGVIKMHTQGETTKRIMLDIITNIAVPMMNREEMTRVDADTFKGMVVGEEQWQTSKKKP